MIGIMPKTPVADEAGEFVSCPELKRKYGISPTALKTAALEGRIATRVAETRIVVFSLADVLAWHEERKQRSARAEKLRAK